MGVALYEEDVLVRTSGFTVDFTTNPQFKPELSWDFYHHHPRLCLSSFLLKLLVKSSQYLSLPHFTSLPTRRPAFPLTSFTTFIRGLKLPIFFFEFITPQFRKSVASQDNLRLALFLLYYTLYTRCVFASCTWLRELHLSKCHSFLKTPIMFTST